MSNINEKLDSLLSDIDKKISFFEQKDMKPNPELLDYLKKSKESLLKLKNI